MTNDTELPDNILTSPSTSAYLLSLGMNPNQVNIARSTAMGYLKRGSASAEVGAWPIGFDWGKYVEAFRLDKFAKENPDAKKGIPAADFSIVDKAFDGLIDALDKLTETLTALEPERPFVLREDIMVATEEHGTVSFAKELMTAWRARLLGRLSTGELADVAGPLATTAVGAILGLEKVIVSQGWEVR